MRYFTESIARMCIQTGALIIKRFSNLKQFLQNIQNKKFQAFSLLEIAIYLAIIGVLTMAVVKGQQLLYQARLEKTITQIETIKLNIENFRGTYGQLPGDYNGTELGLDQAQLGDGDGKIEAAEAGKFWLHLTAAQLCDNKQSKPAVGGMFIVKYNPKESMPGHWLLLCNPGETGIMNTQDALKLKSKLDGHTNNTTGSVRIDNGAGSDECVAENGTLKTSKKKGCVIYIEFP